MYNISEILYSSPNNAFFTYFYDKGFVSRFSDRIIHPETKILWPRLTETNNFKFGFKIHPVEQTAMICFCVLLHRNLRYSGCPSPDSPVIPKQFSYIHISWSFFSCYPLNMFYILVREKGRKLTISNTLESVNLAPALISHSKSLKCLSPSPPRIGGCNAHCYFWPRGNFYQKIQFIPSADTLHGWVEWWFVILFWPLRVEFSINMQTETSMDILSLIINRRLLISADF